MSLRRSRRAVRRRSSAPTSLQSRIVSLRRTSAPAIVSGGQCQRVEPSAIGHRGGVRPSAVAAAERPLSSCRPSRGHSDRTSAASAADSALSSAFERRGRGGIPAVRFPASWALGRQAVIAGRRVASCRSGSVPGQPQYRHRPVQVRGQQLGSGSHRQRQRQRPSASSAAGCLTHDDRQRCWWPRRRRDSALARIGSGAGRRAAASVAVVRRRRASRSPSRVGVQSACRSGIRQRPPRAALSSRSSAAVSPSS